MDSVESALNAARGGASRLEVNLLKLNRKLNSKFCQVCAALSEGGLTPSPGVMAVIAENGNVIIISCGDDIYYHQL